MNLSRIVSSLALLFFVVSFPAGRLDARSFLRGDCNGDGVVVGQVSDAIFQLNWLFNGGPSPSCLDACDHNDDGVVLGQVSDVVYLLNFLFLGGPPPPPPFPRCGADPSANDLGCVTSRVSTFSS